MLDEQDEKLITLGGRQFKLPADRSIECDLFVEEQVHAAGLDALHKEPDEDARAFASRMLAQAIQGGRIWPLLGGLIHPAQFRPEDWSVALARQTGVFLSKLSDPEDKAAIRVILAEAISHFFLVALASATTSAMSSKGTAGSEDERSPQHLPDAPNAGA